MSENYYPNVDIEFIENHVIASGKLSPDGGILKFGTTTTFIMNGPQAIQKRSTIVRELVPGQVCFEQAIAIAFRYSFLDCLLEWLEKHRDWKDGGYVVRQNVVS